ncbi:MAG: hypothetical protein GF334_06895 [Candidatus Altiarchaeales archaeon]|nr:hypothetical protein [Candidatus Altiarchaeales archaeon]
MRDEYVQHLKQRVDAAKDFTIPAGIREGGYRWCLYVYSNLWRTEPSELELLDKAALLAVYKNLQEFHTLFWQRSKLLSLDDDKLMAYKQFLIRMIMVTRDWHHFLISLHLIRNFRERRFYVGDYEVENLPGLKEYIR